jgi:hypothetical protein
VQRKVSRLGNTLIGPTLTIIGTYHLDHFVENPKRPMTTRKRSRSSDSRVVVDVHAIMAKPRQKRSSRMSKPTHLEQLKLSPI